MNADAKAQKLKQQKMKEARDFEGVFGVPAPVGQRDRGNNKNKHKKTRRLKGGGNCRYDVVKASHTQFVTQKWS